jgi:hypothetical protein
METARCGPISQRGVHVRLSCDASSFYSTVGMKRAPLDYMADGCRIIVSWKDTPATDILSTFADTM